MSEGNSKPKSKALEILKAFKKPLEDKANANIAQDSKAGQTEADGFSAFERMMLAFLDGLAKGDEKGKKKPATKEVNEQKDSFRKSTEKFNKFQEKTNPKTNAFLKRLLKAIQNHDESFVIDHDDGTTQTFNTDDTVKFLKIFKEMTYDTDYEFVYHTEIPEKDKQNLIKSLKEALKEDSDIFVWEQEDGPPLCVDTQKIKVFFEGLAESVKEKAEGGDWDSDYFDDVFWNCPMEMLVSKTWKEVTFPNKESVAPSNENVGLVPKQEDSNVPTFWNPKQNPALWIGSGGAIFSVLFLALLKFVFMRKKRSDSKPTYFAYPSPI